MWNLKRNWNPQSLAELENKFTDAKLPNNGVVSVSEATRLQIVYQALSDELGDLVAQALYHEEECKFERDHAYTKAFLTSTKGSDRQREADAKQDATVRIADIRLFEAKAYRKLIENKHESAIRSHHALRAIMKDTEKASWMA